MVSWLNTTLYYANYLPEVKAIMESFEGSGTLVTQAKVSLQTTGLATKLLKIKDQYECLVKHIETMESAKYRIKKAMQAIQELDFGEDTCSNNRYIEKGMQNNDTSKIMNIKRLDISPAAYILLQDSQPTTASAERVFCSAKTVSQGQRLQG